MEAVNKNTEQSRDEPISGVQGKGAANDPYDAGNRDEQPDAPTSNANTAPQEPKLDGQSLTSEPKQAASSTADKPSVTATTDTASKTASGSSNTAAAGLSNSTEDTNADTEADGKKQRDTDNTEGDENAQKQADQGRRGTAAIMEDHGVSKETLKGPQGPAPHAAAEFEKEGKKGRKDEQPAESKGEDSKDSEEVSGSNEKQGVMSKMKEGLTKVAHPHHG